MAKVSISYASEYVLDRASKVYGWESLWKYLMLHIQTMYSICLTEVNLQLINICSTFSISKWVWSNLLSQFQENTKQDMLLFRRNYTEVNEIGQIIE